MEAIFKLLLNNMKWKHICLIWISLLIVSIGCSYNFYQTYANGFIFNTQREMIGTYRNGYILVQHGEVIGNYRNGYILNLKDSVIGTYENGYYKLKNK